MRFTAVFYLPPIGMDQVNVIQFRMLSYFALVVVYVDQDNKYIQKRRLLQTPFFLARPST